MVGARRRVASAPPCAGTQLAAPPRRRRRRDARATCDAVVAARRRAAGCAVLPVVQSTPGWAARRPGDLDLAAARPGAVRALPARARRALRARGLAVGGAARPAARADPRLAGLERAEPHALLVASSRSRAPTSRLLRRRRTRAARAPTRARTVVLAGLPNVSWMALRAIYEAGGRGRFDAVALHPYTRRPRDVVRLVRYARRVMRKRGDGRLPVWVTELSWPAAKGKVDRGRSASRSPTAARRARLGARRCSCSPRRASGSGSSACSGTRGSRPRRGPSAFDWSGLRRDARRRGGLRAGARDVPALGAPARGLREGAGATPAAAAECAG